MGGLGLLALDGCGSVCGDDGWVWSQSNDPACQASGSNSDGTTDGTTDSTSGGPTSDPTTGSTTASGSMSDSDSTSGTTVDPTTDAVTSTTDSSTTGSSTTQGGGLWCTDGDGDGFGDPNNCQEQEFPGAVPNDDDCDDGDGNTHPGAAENESADACMKDSDGDGWGDDNPGPGVMPGNDCDDQGADTFPGAAPNDDPAACMKDVDGDDWGDSDPPPEVTAGTDCDDMDTNVFDCVFWCVDGDGDGFGDANMCVGVPDGGMAPEGSVPNGDDCVDDNPNIYKGAAAQEPELCTLDADGDGYGDDKIADTYPSADNGTDCLDSDANAYPGAAEVEDPAGCMLDADMDGWGDMQPPAGVAPGNDCDDAAASAVVCVEVTPSCTDTNLGMGTQFMATAVGGDGNYSYSWDHPETLSDPMIADPIATPTEITTYTVTVSDGLGNLGADDVTVHLLDKPWVLGGQGAECMAYGFLGVAAPHDFANNGTTTCTTGNSDPTAYVCPTVHKDARITGTMIVNPPADDDDFIGFVWGWQNSDQYYMLHWKQAAQNIGGCNSAAGMTVKRVDRIQAYVAGDFTCNVDTPNAKVLLTPAQTTTQGWVHGVEYGVELLYAQDQTEITITNLGNNMVVAQFVVADATYPSGQFGTYDYSQIRACNGPWNSSCL